MIDEIINKIDEVTEDSDEVHVLDLLFEGFNFVSGDNEQRKSFLKKFSTFIMRTLKKILVGIQNIRNGHMTFFKGTSPYVGPLAIDMDDNQYDFDNQVTIFHINKLSKKDKERGDYAALTDKENKAAWDEYHKYVASCEWENINLPEDDCDNNVAVEIDNELITNPSQEYLIENVYKKFIAKDDYRKIFKTGGEKDRPLDEDETDIPNKRASFIDKDTRKSERNGRKHDEDNVYYRFMDYYFSASNKSRKNKKKKECTC